DDSSIASAEFDRFGRLLKRGLPASVKFGFEQSQLFVTYKRDGLGRVTKVVRPGETGKADPFTSYIDYIGATTIRTSERGDVSKLVRDTKGRTVESTTFDGS